MSDVPTVAPRRPHVGMLIGLGAGVVLGVGANLALGGRPELAWVVTNLAQPAGTIFIRLLVMLVAPLLFSALVMGIAELDLKQVGRLGGRMLGYTVVVSAIAVGIGMVLVNLIRPGDGLHERVADLPAGAQGTIAPPTQTAAETIVAMVPDNILGAAGSNAQLLGLILFSLLFGVALAATRGEGAMRLREVIGGLYDVMMTIIGGVMRLAPFGVGALLFAMTARLGFDLLLELAVYVAVVVGALAIHMFVVYPISVRVFGGLRPFEFFWKIRVAMLTAFSTASSNATLPTALQVADQELGLPRRVSRFVLTAGSAMNQNGTALFEGVTVLFLAQAYGVDLDLGQQLTVMFICILAGIGTAGVPAGSLPVIAMILVRYGIPAEGLGLILGVDRFLDMCRTTLNVTGDLAAAVFVAGGERETPVETGP